MSSKGCVRIAGAFLAFGIMLSSQVSAGAPLGLGGDQQDVPTLAPLRERVTPGVVNIAVRGHVETQPSPLFDDPYFKRFFDIPEQPREREFRAAGSGVIVNAEAEHINATR